MRVQRKWLEELIFGGEAPRRFTQDSPVLPDVWLAFGDAAGPGDPQDLLFTPFRDLHPGKVAQRITEQLPSPGGRRRPETEIASNQAVVAAKLTFPETVAMSLSLSEWWKNHARGTRQTGRGRADERRTLDPSDLRSPAIQKLLIADLEELSRRQLTRELDLQPVAERRGPAVRAQTFTTGLLWFIRVAGTIAIWLERDKRARKEEENFELLRRAAWDFAGQVRQFAAMLPVEIAKKPAIHVISLNRPAYLTVDRSVPTIKADAAVRLFSIRCDRICWAVLDSGVDATHPAFRRRDANGKPLKPAAGAGAASVSRVRRTFDFTRIRTLLNPTEGEKGYVARVLARVAGGGGLDVAGAAKKLRAMLLQGQMLDWEVLLPLLEVAHDAQYPVPANDHGTHVAGILAADWRREDFAKDNPFHPGDEDLIGVCPDITLYDFRIFSGDIRSDEFAIMGALQFIRWLNERGDQAVVHGANLSLSIPHEVSNFACGRTPVCNESSRLVHAGVVVVAAAGNDGRAEYALAGGGSSQGYRSISISDPGNADEVITVGSTHRHQPHTYGVSYFSSRGPTGDGRLKPDLVAPGEKITAPVPTGAGTKDGTSMAAPHVSGAAALLLARHRELLGDPLRVKDILCRTATDLGRERYFQGAGLVDVLRAIQSV